VEYDGQAPRHSDDLVTVWARGSWLTRRARTTGAEWPARGDLVVGPRGRYEGYGLKW
jgi:hypothetical protein